jgi:dynein assembly factor with WDR repeat domains 1
MDATVRVWHVETGACLHKLCGHQGEVVALQFDAAGEKLISGSFDRTAKVRACTGEFVLPC